MLAQPAPDAAKVDEIVRKVNFLGKDCFEDVDKIKKFASVVSKRVQKAINKTHRKVELIFAKMQSQIKEFDFTKMETHNITEEDENAEDRTEKAEDTASSTKTRPKKENPEHGQEQEDSNSTRTGLLGMGSRKVERNR